MPKRVDPELNSSEFVDRSFENELKQIPKDPMLLGNEKKDVQKIRKIEVAASRKSKTTTNKD